MRSARGLAIVSALFATQLLPPTVFSRAAHLVDVDVVAQGKETPPVRLRPQAMRRVDDLAIGEVPDTDASAGWDAFQRGDLEGARTALGVAASRRGAASWVHYALGVSHYALQQYADAIVEWEKVRSSNPTYEPVYFDLVDGYLQTKDRGRALRVLRAARDHWPRDPDVLNALSVVHAAGGDLNGAIKASKDAIAIDPTDPTAYFNLGKAHEQRFFRSIRYVKQTRSFMRDETDRAQAIAAYRRYLELKGPYADAVKKSLSQLDWEPK